MDLFYIEMYLELLRVCLVSIKRGLREEVEGRVDATIRCLGSFESHLRRAGGGQGNDVAPIPPSQEENQTSEDRGTPPQLDDDEWLTTDAESTYDQAPAEAPSTQPQVPGVSESPEGMASQSLEQVDPTPEIDQPQCIACLEMKPSAIRAACDHHFCVDCIETLFENSLEDEALFPPRCCEAIPLSLSSVRDILKMSVVIRFMKKEIRRDDPSPTYCSNADCSSYILPDLIEDDVGECDSCHQRTCTHCKKLAHACDCRDDPELESVLEAARTEGWQRCYICHAMVELRSGCNHIT